MALNKIIIVELGKKIPIPDGLSFMVPESSKRVQRFESILTNTYPELQFSGECLPIDMGEDCHFLDNLLTHHIQKSLQRGKRAHSCPLTFDLDPRSPPFLGCMTFPLLAHIGI